MILLRTNKLLGILTLSQFIELLGAAFFNIALLVYASQTSNPKAATTVVVIANTIPSILQIGLGYFADKANDKLRLMISTRILQAILYFFLMILFGLSMNEWLLFSFIIMINVSSDLLSGITSLATLPVIKHIVPSKKILEARSLQVSIMSLVNVIGQVIGVTFLTFLNNNFSYFSALNTLLFLISGLVLLVSRKAFNEKIQIASKTSVSEAENNFLQSIKISMHVVRANKSLMNILFLFAFLNLLVGSVEGLISLSLLQYPKIYIQSYGFSLSLANTALASGLILGSFLTNDFFKSFKLNTLIIGLLLFLIVLCFDIIYFPNIYVIITSFFGIGYILGKISPRVSTYVMTNVAETQLGQITGFMNTLVTLSVPIGQLIFLSIANSFTVNISWIGMLILSMLLIIYIFLYKKI
ncbi:MFS transporter [Leuconostoc citreum]|uniref:MFS transporter n=2 Tax=Leuconostoc citreum TaxID=33964 RepID=UPI0011204858|nr:MFS transporter [Leuconostoc citreum]QEA46392.1 MFS transporter [Leuconostoc citreum]QEA63082.1 MFS transporter [Leuconostoc citreum]TOY70480.1 MFS transporter [Leuconostoc citreum]